MSCNYITKTKIIGKISSFFFCLFVLFNVNPISTVDGENNNNFLSFNGVLLLIYLV